MGGFVNVTGLGRAPKSFQLEAPVHFERVVDTSNHTEAARKIRRPNVRNDRGPNGSVSISGLWDPKYHQYIVRFRFGALSDPHHLYGGGEVSMIFKDGALHWELAGAGIGRPWAFCNLDATGENIKAALSCTLTNSWVSGTDQAKVFLSKMASDLENNGWLLGAGAQLYTNGRECDAFTPVVVNEARSNGSGGLWWNFIQGLGAQETF